jgi:hypothetical protein
MTRHKHRVAAKRAGHPHKADGITQVMRELAATGGSGPRIDPLVERLSQCPEAFKAGEMVGKMCDALKYDGAAGDERYLPPAGLVMPPV